MYIKVLCGYNFNDTLNKQLTSAHNDKGHDVGGVKCFMEVHQVLVDTHSAILGIYQ